MESANTNTVDEDIITIRVLEPKQRPSTFKITKNFTLGMLKEIVKDSLFAIHRDYVNIELVQDEVQNINGKERDHMTLRQLKIKDETEIKVSKIP